MDSLTDFKRMMLRLPRSAKDYGSVAFAAELAELLRLDLVGVFAEDSSLMDLAVLPCVREFRLSGEGWQRLDAAQLEHGAAQAAAEARHLFDEAVKTLHVGKRFDLVKGPIGEVIGSQAMAGDILVIIEPKNPAERVTHQFRQLMNAALSEPASALLVPSRIIRRKGPVVTISGSEHDVSTRVGAGLAEAMQERLIMLTPAHADEMLMVPPTAGISVERRSMRGSHIGMMEIESLLALTSERLVVLSRGVDVHLAPRLAFERGVPVLLTGNP